MTGHLLKDDSSIDKIVEPPERTTIRTIHGIARYAYTSSFVTGQPTHYYRIEGWKMDYSPPLWLVEQWEENKKFKYES